MEAELLTAYLSKTLNMDQQQVADLVKTEEGEFKSDALALLLEKNSSHIETLQAKAKPSEEVLSERFNNGYAKAKEEVLTKRENEIKQLKDLLTVVDTSKKWKVESGINDIKKDLKRIEMCKIMESFIKEINLYN